nr:uncharacterized protein LOC131772211 [Pocillopora verrucosa]
MPLPVDGASTRRYLTAMATANARGSTSDESSDLSDESDSNHGGHNAGPSVVSSDSEDDINEVIVYSEEARLYGYVTDDFSTSGVITGEGVHSRTTEVLQCINILEDRGQSTAISFLIHSFEEFTWQGTEDGRIMVAVLLPFSCPLASKRRLVSMLNTVANSPHIYFWIAKDSSHEAQKVRVKYGVSQSPGIVVFVLAPCHSRNMPQCVEIFEESNLDCAGLQESIGRAQALYSAMRDERKKLDDWRKQRQSQELQYQALQSSPSNSTNIASSSLGTSSNNTVNNQDETSQTRAQRRGRVTAPPTNGGGTTIGVHINNGKKFSRAFEKNAFFQEVYDWIGSLVEVPLHFTLQRGREVVRHSDHLQGDEVLDLLERNTEEMTNLEQSLVSFKGNYPSDEEELSETMKGKHKSK